MSRKGTSTLLLGVLLLGGLLVNLLAQRYKFRIDLTADKRYTLSAATLDLLHRLPETVTVHAYFTKDLPPALAAARQDFHDLLVEYAERSDGRVVFAFDDPGGDAERTAKAVNEGMRPLLVQTRKQDRSENIQVLMGATVRMGERRAVIPALQEGPGMEWILSSAIAQVARKEKPLIGVLQGHMEPSLRALDELALQLQAQYDVEATAIHDSFPINDRFSALLWIDPKDSVPAQHLHRIDQYMAQGHGVVLAYEAVESDLLLSAEVRQREIGIGPWLAGRGVQVQPQAVADQRCGQVNVMQSAAQRPVSIPFPWYPLMEKFSGHPVAHGLDLVLFQFAAPLACLPSALVAKCTPVLATSTKSTSQALPFMVDLRRPWTDADFNAGAQVVGMVLEPADTSHGRLVVFSNGNFCTGDQAGRQVALPKGNLDLMVNATDWVMKNTSLLSIRGKSNDHRPIRDPGDAMRNRLKWLNLLLPMGVVLLYAVLRAQWRRWQRRQRMRPGHVR